MTDPYEYRDYPYHLYCKHCKIKAYWLTKDDAPECPICGHRTKKIIAKWAEKSKPKKRFSKRRGQCKVKRSDVEILVSGCELCKRVEAVGEHVIRIGGRHLLICSFCRDRIEVVKTDFYMWE